MANEPHVKGINLQTDRAPVVVGINLQTDKAPVLEGINIQSDLLETGGIEWQIVSATAIKSVSSIQ